MDTDAVDRDDLDTVERNLEEKIETLDSKTDGIGNDLDDVQSNVERLSGHVEKLMQGEGSVAPIAEAIRIGFDQLSRAVQHMDIDIDLGAAIERGLDGMGREIKDGLESGLSQIAREVRQAAP